ncbi:MAG TPA: hypothetical protein VGW37_15145, partial [Terriglobia bacterium]|nr:hypothetical protein [Terriglobia bacterium]
MKTIRSLTAMLGLFLALYALGAAGARAQAIYSTQFVGKFTLPFATQWGTMTLPPGDYTLEYGARETGHRVVNVQGTAKGSPHGMILAGPGGGTS